MDKFSIFLMAVIGLILISTLANAITLTTFSDGVSSKTITFGSAGSDTSTNIKIPKGVIVTSASMNIGNISPATFILSSGQTSAPYVWNVDDNAEAWANDVQIISDPDPAVTTFHSSYTSCVKAGPAWWYGSICPNPNFTSKYPVKIRVKTWDVYCCGAGISTLYLRDLTNGIDYLLDGTGVPMDKTWNIEFSYPTNPSIDVGNDGDVEWSYVFYDSCSIQPETTKCCCFVGTHVHDIGSVQDVINITSTYAAGGEYYSPGATVNWAISTDKSTWTTIYSEGPAPSHKYITTTFPVNKRFRYVKVWLTDTPHPWIDDSDVKTTIIFNKTEKIDFTSELQSLLSTCTADANGDCTIPIKVSSESAGKIVLNNLNIAYGLSNGAACSLNSDCFSGYCKSDYDGSGAWCANSDQCVHDGTVYNNGANAPDCYNSGTKRYCNSGTWSTSSCGTNVNINDCQYTDYYCSGGSCGSQTITCSTGKATKSAASCTSVASSNYCGTSGYNTCSGSGSPNTCQKRGFYRGCAGSGSTCSDTDTGVYYYAYVSTAGYVCSSGSEVAATSTAYCGTSGYNACSTSCQQRGNYLGCNANTGVCGAGVSYYYYNYCGANTACSGGSCAAANYCATDQCINSSAVCSKRCDGSGSCNNWAQATCTDRDASQTLCTKSTGGCTAYYWNIGGEIAASSCCGDDSSENKKTRTCGFKACTSDSNDDACCSATNKCVFNSVCYANGYIGNPSGDGTNEKCESGTWLDTIAPTIVISRTPSMVYDYNQITFTSTAADTDGIKNHKVKYWVNDALNEKDCGASSTCTVTIGPYAGNIVIKYQGEATDNANNVGSTSINSFTVEKTNNVHISGNVWYNNQTANAQIQSVLVNATIDNIYTNWGYPDSKGDFYITIEHMPATLTQFTVEIKAQGEIFSKYNCKYTEETKSCTRI